MKVHELKLNYEYFEEVACGDKLFEIRKNDRKYQVGDLLVLRNFANLEKFTGYVSYANNNVLSLSKNGFIATHGKWVDIQKEDAMTIVAKVTNITDYMQPDGYVVLGIKILE